MEEKSSEVNKYLRTVVNPFLQPMVQELAYKKPTDVPQFIFDYVSNYLNNVKKAGSCSESQNDEQAKELLKKLEEKKKKKKGNGDRHSRQGISAQVYGAYNKKKTFKAKVIPKDTKTKEKIMTLINKSILFQALNDDDKQIVMNAMDEVRTSKDSHVIQEGEQGDQLYIIAEGDFDCYKVLKGTNTYLKTYKPGEYFGELALMYNAPRAATIISKAQGKLYSLDRQTFINIVQQAAIKKRKLSLEILSKVEILSEIDPYEKEQICDVLKEQNFKAGDYVVHQGDDGSKFYIVAEGKLIAEKNENGTIKKVFEYKDGDYFGEIALVRDTVRQASIKAETNCRLVSIERDSFKRLLGPIEEILKRNMDKYKKYCPQ